MCIFYRIKRSIGHVVRASAIGPQDRRRRQRTNSTAALLLPATRVNDPTTNPSTCVGRSKAQAPFASICRDLLDTSRAKSFTTS